MAVRVWLLRLGPIAWARADYPSIGGWRRVFWRLWVRVGKAIKAIPAVRIVEPPPAAIPPKILHWSSGEPEGMPFCGARKGEPWTVEIEFTTCSKCKNEAGPLIDKHRMNTR